MGQEEEGAGEMLQKGFVVTLWKRLKCVTLRRFSEKLIERLNIVTLFHDDPMPLRHGDVVPAFLVHLFQDFFLRERQVNDACGLRLLVTGRVDNG